jgi:hypothetical protein
MSFGDVVNKFHNKYSLSDSSTTEESNLTSSGVGGKEIDDLDTGNKERSTSSLFRESGSVSVDGSVLFFKIAFEDGTTFIDGLSDNVDDSSEGGSTDGHQDRGTDISDSLTTDETFSRVESDGTDV